MSSEELTSNTVSFCLTMIFNQCSNLDLELINFFIKRIEKYISENTLRSEDKLPFRKIKKTIRKLDKMFFSTKDKHPLSVKNKRKHSQNIDTVLNNENIPIVMNSKDMRAHSVKIKRKHSENLPSVVNKHNNEENLKCDYCDFSFNYMIGSDNHSHTKIDKKYMIDSDIHSQTKIVLWIPPLQ